jgi:FkbM family methyltransferase
MTAMLRNAARRIRFELLRRLNRIRPGFRFAHAPIAGRRRVVYRATAGVERTLDLRDGTTDLTVFHEIFVDRPFDLTELKRRGDVERRYRDILSRGKRPLIVDAGANCGLSAIYFREQYPEALIVALEPEARNFAELERHLGTDQLCIRLHAALAASDGHVNIVDAGEGEWAFRTTESAKGVPAYAIASVIEMAGPGAEPFGLKIDIEGSERELFDDAATLDKFYLVFVELHDWLIPKEGASRSFLKASASLDRDFIVRRDHVVSIKN